MVGTLCRSHFCFSSNFEKHEASLPVVKLDVRESLSAGSGRRLLKPRRLAQSARELSIVVTSPSPLPNSSTTSLF